jgi:membrane-bound metal-dependent hydrolase YbcI (DUF457 family)
MLAVGHFALGYFAGKVSARWFRVKTNLALLLTASIIPDFDLFLDFSYHRGPVHSLFIITFLMLPFLIYWKKKSVPYFLAALTHSLIGDYWAGGVQLFWPFSNDWFGIFDVLVNSPLSFSLEFILFIISVSIMLKTGDLQALFHPSNLDRVLIIPLMAILFSAFIILTSIHGFGAALLLFFSCVFYFAVFSFSLILNIARDKKQLK